MFTCKDLSHLITFRSISGIAVLIILYIIYNRGNILWCICVGFLFLLIYYLLRRVFGNDEIYTAMDVQEIQNVKRLENVLQVVYTKWQELGSLANLKSNINFINYLYAIRPWSVFDQDSFTAVVESVEEFLNPKLSQSERVKLRTSILQNLQAFSKLQGYEEAVTQFNTISLDYL